MHQGPRRVGVIEVEVGKLHAAVLDHLVPPAALADVAVAGAALVRVLAVAERLGQFQRQMDGGGKGGGSVSAGGCSPTSARRTN